MGWTPLRSFWASPQSSSWQSSSSRLPAVAEGESSRSGAVCSSSPEAPTMDLQLSGKVAIVTGASRGIGRAIAQVLSAEGMHLVLAARSRDLLDQLAASLPTPSLV